MQFGDVQIIQVLDLTLYRITVNAANADFTSDADAELAEILAGLLSAVNGLTEPVSARTIGLDRIFILPDTITATHTYAVNDPNNLSLMVGFQSTKPTNPSKPALLIEGTAGDGTVFQSNKPSQFGWRSRFLNP